MFICYCFGEAMSFDGSSCEWNKNNVLMNEEQQKMAYGTLFFSRVFACKNSSHFAKVLVSCHACQVVCWLIEFSKIYKIWKALDILGSFQFHVMLFNKIPDWWTFVICECSEGLEDQGDTILESLFPILHSNLHPRNTNSHPQTLPASSRPWQPNKQSEEHMSLT